MAIQGLYNRIKQKHDLLLRVGFGVFLSVWGLDRIFRASLWASEGLMGHFYGSLGLIVAFVAILGIVQVLIALSLFTNYQVKFSSAFLLVMLFVSTLVTIVPLVNYLTWGGNPVPAIIFIDHFPLLAGAWAIHAHAK